MPPHWLSSIEIEIVAVAEALRQHDTLDNTEVELIADAAAGCAELCTAVSKRTWRSTARVGQVVELIATGTAKGQPGSRRGKMARAVLRFVEGFWRRRPDLNRGWRFCRQGRDVYLVDSSCFLVSPTPPFSLVFGRYCSQVVPNCGRAAFVPHAPTLRLRHGPPSFGCADARRVRRQPVDWILCRGQAETNCALRWPAGRGV